MILQNEDYYEDYDEQESKLYLYDIYKITYKDGDGVDFIETVEKLSKFVKEHEKEIKKVEYLNGVKLKGFRKTEFIYYFSDDV